MANQEHLDILKRGVMVWNQWREETPRLQPNLHGADLSNKNLSLVNLSGTNLSHVKLEKANLHGAFLYEANFRLANLQGADLSEAYLPAVAAPGSARGGCYALTDQPYPARGADFCPEHQSVAAG